MKPWAEDNYLERLMPQLRQANRVNMESCPDSELLTAYSEDRLSPFVRGAVTEHLARCSECSELCARVESFARASVPEQDREWVNAEKRLENWGDAFLRSRALQARPTPEARPTSVLQWKGTSRAAVSAWKLAWAVAGVAALGLVVAGVLVTKRDSLARFRPAPPPVQVAVQQTPAPAISNPTARAPSATPDTSASTAKPAEGLAHPGLEKNSIRPQRPVPASPELASAARNQKKPAPYENVGADEATSQIAPNYSPVETNPNDRIQAGNAQTGAAGRPALIEQVSEGSRPAAPASSSRIPLPPAPAKPAVPQAAGPLPATLRLEAGSRLWIRLGSTNRQSDGSFTFQGSLIQPVENAAAGRVLDSGTELVGSGTVINGKVIAFVRSFVLQGVPYTVSGSDGPSNEQMPGAGKALQFEDGRVLEMWLSAASVYARPSGSQPKP
jgi:hypothetical protein